MMVLNSRHLRDMLVLWFNLMMAKVRVALILIVYAHALDKGAIVTIEGCNIIVSGSSLHRDVGNHGSVELVYAIAQGSTHILAEVSRPS